jgi:hypothetical protein
VLYKDIFCDIRMIHIHHKSFHQVLWHQGGFRVWFLTCENWSNPLYSYLLSIYLSLYYWITRWYAGGFIEQGYTHGCGDGQTYDHHG